MTQDQFVGIDMAKDKFDVNLLNQERTIKKTFDNTQQGFTTFYKWLNKQSQRPWVCLEATGHYSEVLADFLCQHQLKVSIVNPMTIKQFTKLRLVRNKNDIIDARMIREFAEIYKPRLFQSKPHEQKQLREFIQVLDTLKQQKTQWGNKQRVLQLVDVKNEAKKIIRLFDKKIEGLTTKIKTIIQRSTSLNKTVMALTQIKGIALLSACRIMAYLPDIQQFESAKQLAAYTGISPRQCESGKYRGRTRLSKMGNRKLRRALYMPAIVAKNHNEHLQPFIKRLEGNGLAPKAIIGAVMRKLIHIIYGMLKHNKPFDPLLV